MGGHEPSEKPLGSRAALDPEGAGAASSTIKQKYLKEVLAAEEKAKIDTYRDSLGFCDRLIALSSELTLIWNSVERDSTLTDDPETKGQLQALIIRKAEDYCQLINTTYRDAIRDAEEDGTRSAEDENALDAGMATLVMRLTIIKSHIVCSGLSHQPIVGELLQTIEEKITQYTIVRQKVMDTIMGIERGSVEEAPSAPGV